MTRRYTQQDQTLNLEMGDIDRRLAALESLQAVPVGTMVLWIRPASAPSFNIPDKFLLCDGTEYARSQYPELSLLLENFGGTPTSPDGFIVPTRFTTFSSTDHYYIVKALP